MQIGTVGIAMIEAEKARKEEWTLSRKIWEAVKNRPDILAKNLPKLLNSNVSSTSSLVNQLVKRGMLVSVPETMEEFKRRKPTGAGRPSIKLHVSPELRGTYEWLPLVRPAKEPAPKPSPQVPKSEVPKSEMPKLEDLTIKEARALYLELKKLFGEG